MILKMVQERGGMMGQNINDLFSHFALERKRRINKSFEYFNSSCIVFHFCSLNVFYKDNLIHKSFFLC